MPLCPGIVQEGFWGSIFYGGKILTQSEYFQWPGSERVEKRMRNNVHKFFLFPLAKRLPVHQTLWGKKAKKTSTPNLPLQPFSVSFKPKSQIHLVADLMSPRCQLHSSLSSPHLSLQHTHFTLFKDARVIKGLGAEDIKGGPQVRLQLRTHSHLAQRFCRALGNEWALCSVESAANICKNGFVRWQLADPFPHSTN